MAKKKMSTKKPVKKKTTTKETKTKGEAISFKEIKDDMSVNEKLIALQDNINTLTDYKNSLVASVPLDAKDSLLTQTVNRITLANEKIMYMSLMKMNLEMTGRNSTEKNPSEAVTQ